MEGEEIMMWPEEALTVGQLNGLIREVIQMGFPQAVWVCGEIQGYNRNRQKNHIFFELCEKDPSSHEILARAGLVIFSGRKRYIQDLLAQAQNAFQLKDDIEVKFLCRVDFYPPHGALRLVVEGIDPAYTLGKIAQQKQRLIAELKKEGILDANKALPFPLVPLRIGLITSHDSAAYNDFVAQLRASGYGFQIYCRNALMQGKGVEPDVCAALAQLDRRGDLDVIVITRGGGSLADLSWFDSRRIACQIAACRVPVVCGIGHEINITVTDLAAYLHQKTPTAIAQYLVGCVDRFRDAVADKARLITTAAREALAGRRQGLRALAQGLHSHTHYFLRLQRQQLLARQATLAGAAPRRLSGDQRDLRQRGVQVTQAALRLLSTAHTRMEQCQRLVEMADPVRILRRGFSLTRTAEGTLLRQAAQIQPGAMIRTQLADGQVDSQVRRVLDKEA